MSLTIGFWDGLSPKVGGGLILWDWGLGVRFVFVVGDLCFEPIDIVV